MTYFLILAALTYSVDDLNRDEEFCRDARAVAYIIGEREVLDRARAGGAPEWKIQKTAKCFWHRSNTNG